MGILQNYDISSTGEYIHVAMYTKPMLLVFQLYILSQPIWHLFIHHNYTHLPFIIVH